MSSYPRTDLSRIGDAALTASLKPLSWSIIKERIRDMDAAAVGGVHPDATMAAALVLALHEARTRAPDHRSFPGAADGRSMPPMGDELMAAGLSDTDARFVASQLRRDGYYLVRADDLGWADIRRFQGELEKGQGVYEDAGGFFVRAIMALFGQEADEVLTYRQAAQELLNGLVTEREVRR